MLMLKIIEKIHSFFDSFFFILLNVYEGTVPRSSFFLHSSNNKELTTSTI